MQIINAWTKCIPRTEQTVIVTTFFARVDALGVPAIMPDWPRSIRHMVRSANTLIAKTRIPMS